MVWSIGTAVADLAGWIGGTLIQTFTAAYDKIVTFVSEIKDMILNWATKVREYIQTALNDLLISIGTAISEVVNDALKWLDEHLLERFSMPASEQSAFLASVNSPIKQIWDLENYIIKRCITGFAVPDIGSCASDNIGSPSMDSELYEHCGQSDESETKPPSTPSEFGAYMQSSVSINSVRIAPCVSIKQIRVSSAELGSFLGCIVGNVPSFMVSLFDKAKDAVQSIISTIQGWIQSSIDWAVQKIQELWNGITGVVSSVHNFLGRRLAEELTGDDLPILTEAINEDPALAHTHKLRLLDMCSKIAHAKAEFDALKTSGRRRMKTEMDDHSAQLKAELGHHHERRRRGLQSDQEAASANCATLHPPIQIESAAIALSLPFSAIVTLDATSVLTGRVQKVMIITSPFFVCFPILTLTCHVQPVMLRTCSPSGAQSQL